MSTMAELGEQFRDYDIRSNPEPSRASYAWRN